LFIHAINVTTVSIVENKQMWDIHAMINYLI